MSEDGAALREGPVYVDPGAAGQLSKSDADALAQKIEDAGEPVSVAVLPARLPAGEPLPEPAHRDRHHRSVRVRLGDGFDARADRLVMPPGAVRSLVTAVQGAGDRRGPS
ncbi:hypothetical protein STANM309S_05793 [Streptomyces tanashiensis]